MERFTAPVTIEGSIGKTRNLRITVPKPTIRKLIGFEPPGWVRLHVDGFEPIFAWARRPPSRPSVDIGLPARIFPASLNGQTIEATIEDARPYRAPSEPRLFADGFDWLPFVSEHYFPTETVDGRLLLHNRYEEPFEMRRLTPVAPTYRMLGLYQAEGSKSEQAPDFMMTSTNPELLRCMVNQLGVLGLPPERLSLEVLHGPDSSAAAARAAFDIGVPVVAERATTTPSQKKADAGVLHVRKSKPFLRLVKRALEMIFASEFPSKEAAREYALGWLDGDGTITIVGPTTTELRLAGLEDEHRVLQQALRTAFGWEQKGSGYIDNKQGTHITLRAIEMLQLLEADAFAFSMSRVRLLLAFDRRTAGLRNRPNRGAFKMWGLVDEEGVLTEIGEAVCRGHTQLLPEIKKARQLEATAPLLFGVKGAQNPLSTATSRRKP